MRKAPLILLTTSMLCVSASTFAGTGKLSKFDQCSPRKSDCFIP